MTARPDTRTPEQVEHAELHLDRLGDLGDTLAELDGEPVNVFGGILGERVVARIVRYRRRRKHFVSGIVTQVLEPSTHRVEPPCPFFGPCTGCQWQHIDYDHQLFLKRATVLDHFKQHEPLRDVEVALPLAAPEKYEYRNHARFTSRREGGLGFVNRITRRFVEIDRCMLMAPWINDTLAELKGLCGETSQLTMRYGINTGDWLIQPHLQNKAIERFTGQPHYEEKLLGHKFRVGSPSFFQVNTRQAERMLELVCERLRLTGEETVVDAYAGVGVFAVAAAERARRVIAIEESHAAVEDAAVNAGAIQNLEYVEGKTEHVLSSLEETPDAVVLDPPRAGCHETALKALLGLAPPRVVYVSCDPKSLARDLAILVAGGYAIESVEPIDMFPHTHHIECIATLVLRDK